MKNAKKKSKKDESFKNHILPAYIFALKEGGEINDNLLDYSLMLLQVNHAILIPSPHSAGNN